MDQGIIVQAHCENWGGGKSYCLSNVDGSPVILCVLRKLRAYYSNLDIVLAVPDVVENRLFEQYAKEVGGLIYYGSKASVLGRFLGAASKYKFDSFIRIVGEHYFVDLQFIDRLRQMFETNTYDIVIPPLDFDPKFGGEIVSKKSLEKLRNMLSSSRIDSVGNILANPLQYIATHPESFKTGIEKNVPRYSDNHMMQMRSSAKQIYLEAYVHDPNKSQIEGDTLRTHYELAKRYIRKDATVLDIACGDGWGSLILSETGARIVGADISVPLIEAAKTRSKLSNVSFEVHDALHMNFLNNSFDVVASMETIEHIDDQPFLREVHRILRADGTFIVSTPQSSNSSLPLVPYHLREYSLEAFEKLLSQFFEVCDFYTFRSNLVLEGKHLGTGMMAVCLKCK